MCRHFLGGSDDCIFGLGGALTSSILAIPQALKIYRDPLNISGVAISTWVLLVLNALIWLLYAIATEAYPVGVPSLINGPAAIYVLVKVGQQRALVATDQGVEEEHHPSELTKAWFRVDQKWRK